MKNLICALLVIVSFSVTANDVAGYKIEGNRLLPVDNVGNRLYNHESFRINGKNAVSTDNVGNRTYTNNNFKTSGNSIYKTDSVGNRIYGVK